MVISLYTVHTNEGRTSLPFALGELVGSAAHDGAGAVQDDHVVVHQVFSAVGAADVEAQAGPLHVEAIEHEDGRHDVSIKRLENNCLQ